MGQAAPAEAAKQRAGSDRPELIGAGETFAFPDWYGYVGSFDEPLKAEIERAVRPTTLENM